MTHSFHLKRARRPSKTKRRGFTVVEAMTVLAVAGIGAAIMAPRFHSVMVNRQLDTVTSGAQSVLKRAQSMAARLNTTVVVEPIYGTHSGFRVFADVWDEESSANGSDLKLTEDSADRLLFEWSLQGESKLPLYFWSSLDENAEGPLAFQGFTTHPEDDELPPLLVFSPPSGRIQDRGELSITLSGPSGQAVSCRTLAVVTIIGQTRVSPCLVAETEI